jgi:P27 family predicted phage terminase small subunit
MPGPSKTPTAILKLRGSRRASGRGDSGYATEAPKRPAWLKGESRQKWDELSEQLSAIGVLTTTDADALARYCDLWSHWLQARKQLHELQKADTVDAQFFRWQRVYRALGEQLHRVGREFGLTPTARIGLDIKPGRQGSKLSRFKGNAG